MILASLGTNYRFFYEYSLQLNTGTYFADRVLELEGEYECEYSGEHVANAHVWLALFDDTSASLTSQYLLDNI
jgi:hypothetical protein